VHTFQRTYLATYAVLDTLTNRAATIELNNLPNYAEFTNLFDAYRITKVVARFIYDQNSAQATPAVGGTQNVFMPSLVTVNDYDDATPLAAITDYVQYETFKVERMDRPIVRTFKPKVAVPAYAGGAFSGYLRGSDASPWIDAASPNVELYGLKYGVQATMEGGIGTKQMGALSIYWTYTVEAKDTR